MENKRLYDTRLDKDSCGVGMMAHIQKVESHPLVVNALKMLARMDHRGGEGAEANESDGCGILTSIPKAYFRKVILKEFSKTVDFTDIFAIAQMFLPRDKKLKDQCEKEVEKIIREYGFDMYGWRDLPLDIENTPVSKRVLSTMPNMRQLFIKNKADFSEDEFERILFVIKRRLSIAIAPKMREKDETFYICSLSSRTIVYKGMIMPKDIAQFFVDLKQKEYTSYLAMVHSRFSTNTAPTWERAQPFSMICHNGEINTIQGNKKRMTAREGIVSSKLLGDEIKNIFPMIYDNLSDSGYFDESLELLHYAGRDLPHAVMMMIPEAWQNDKNMSEKKKSFYNYHSAIMEPWDGPASISFTNGKCVGCVLDRNGLRPSRYYVTHDDMLIMASEVGVVDVEPSNIKKKGRLEPGKMFLLDFEQKKIIKDEDLKNQYIKEKPYKEWIRDHAQSLDKIPEGRPLPKYDLSFNQQMNLNYFTSEVLHFTLAPMIEQERDPLSSMGNDAPLVCLSSKSSLLYDYFKQMFAQVTNPPIDSIREEIIMSIETYIGPESNPLDSDEKNVQRLFLRNPILSEIALSKISDIKINNWRSEWIDICYDPSKENLKSAIKRIVANANKLVMGGASFLILSDRSITNDTIAIPAPMILGAVHNSLVFKQLRSKTSLIVDSAEVKDVHQFCVLFGYGADAICPYLAYEVLSHMYKLKKIQYKGSEKELIFTYHKAVKKGILKVMGKMGISTLQSYKGAQIFEIIGLNKDIVDLCFESSISRIEGVGFDDIEREILERKQKVQNFEEQNGEQAILNEGNIHWRMEGETHMWNPETIHAVQQAAQNNNYESYKSFAKLVNEQYNAYCTLRGLLDFTNESPIDISEVEPAKDIVKRFATGAMSLGSISREAHESLAVAMNKIEAKSNSGEGGEKEYRFYPDDQGVDKNSAIKQVASGRFGVTIHYLNHAQEIQIKVAQGAKPGEGGELPGKKVDEFIANHRNSTPGVGLISPPPHHDIYSIEDLAQLIFDLKNANRNARISVKLVSEAGVGTIASGVAKCKAEHIVIAGHDGGTGASPLTSIKHAGLPWELGIAETHQALMANNLRSKVVLQTDGQLKTGRDVAIAALLGAEEFGFATAPLITLGCIMMRKCHLNTCPVGIATQDPVLRKKFKGKPESVVNYFFMVAEELREIMARLGFKTIIDMVGRTDKLKKNDKHFNSKAKLINLDALLYKTTPNFSEIYGKLKQNHGLDQILDTKILEQVNSNIISKKRVSLSQNIKNTDRSVGAILSSEIARKHGNLYLPEETIQINFKGSAGQSLGAFLAKGLVLDVEGDANDYVGKGLSGGMIIVRPPKESTFKSHKNIIAGNVCLYGATSGEAYFGGIVAERFAVRNSGAVAVVEGLGDHGCEYMTGGTVVVLGDFGKNFGAGMSGGIAYVFDPKNKLPNTANLQMIDIDPLEEDDFPVLEVLIGRHIKYTDSNYAKKLYKDWNTNKGAFKKIFPKDYKAAIKEKE